MNYTEVKTAVGLLHLLTLSIFCYRELPTYLY